MTAAFITIDSIVYLCSLHLEVRFCMCQLCQSCMCMAGAGVDCVFSQKPKCTIHRCKPMTVVQAVILLMLYPQLYIVCVCPSLPSFV